MTKLYNPRKQIGYFVGCESKAIYLIYSLQKHKVYRISVTRVEDSEGLDNPHNAPCLKDRVPTSVVKILEQLDISGDGSEDLQVDKDEDQLDRLELSTKMVAIVNNSEDEDIVSPL